MFLACGVNANVRVYSPKLKKNMKFVAHKATVVHNFMANKATYITALTTIINHPETTDDSREKARGFLKGISKKWQKTKNRSETRLHLQETGTGYTLEFVTIRS